jgi:hypothetical protein
VILAKSILVGLCSTFAAAFLLLLGAIVALAIIPHPEGTAFAIDPISVAKSSPLLWILAVLVFSVAFSWEYRRAKRRQSK